MEKQKECFKCNIIKPLSEFYKHPEMADGTVNKCKDCNKKDNVENWHEKRPLKIQYDLTRYRYSVQRIFDNRYNGIKQRCLGQRSNGKKYRVYGSKFLAKVEWNKWCYESNNFKRFMELYAQWVAADFDEKLSPSIDRINNGKCYVEKNLQWLTKSENSSKYTH